MLLLRSLLKSISFSMPKVLQKVRQIKRVMRSSCILLPHCHSLISFSLLAANSRETDRLRLLAPRPAVRRLSAFGTRVRWPIVLSPHQESPIKGPRPFLTPAKVSREVELIFVKASVEWGTYSRFL